MVKISLSVSRLSQRELISPTVFSNESKGFIRIVSLNYQIMIPAIVYEQGENIIQIFEY